MVILLYVLLFLIIISFILLIIFSMRIQLEIIELSVKTNKIFNLNYVKLFVDNLVCEDKLTKEEIFRRMAKAFLDIEYVIKVDIRLLNSIKIFSMKFNTSTIEILNKKISKQKFLENKIVKKIESENKIIEEKINIRNIVDLLPEIKKMNLYIGVGTPDLIVSMYLSSILNIMATIILTRIAEKNKQEYIYNWNYFISQLPTYSNCINLAFSCIVEWNFAHIIHIVKILRNRSVKKSGKSSNRKSDEKCYG